MRRLIAAACLCGGVILALVLTLTLSQARETRGFGLFSWEAAVLEEDEAQALEECIRRAQVTELYQTIPEDWLTSGQAGAFVQRMSGLGVEVYALTGDPQWALDPEGTELIRTLEAVAAYNAGQRESNRIAGLMADVEPYLLEEWDAGEDARAALMDCYRSGMEAAYACAVENGLRLWVCVPTFYDVTSPEVLEKLVSGACDGVAVMNYNRRDEYGQMEAEVSLAERYGKQVLCIYELQEAGRHDLEEINTYAGVGLEALYRSAEELEQAFGYEGLGFAYHYYQPLKDMLEAG